MRLRRWGSVELEGHRDYTPLSEYWKSRIHVTPFGCWEWPVLSPEGYGYASDGRKVWMHRWVWRLLVGAIPEKHEIDHLCRNPACCNPEHHESVTGSENKARQRRPNAVKTHCPQGHAYDDANTMWSVGANGGPKRSCRTCGRIATSNYRARQSQKEQDT